LGIYSLADRLMRLPLANVTDVTSSVMFPALSSIQHDVEAIRRAYLRGTRMIALVIFPTMIALCVLAEPAILVVYGAKWRGSIVILQLLCFAGLAQSTYNTASWIFMSQGRTDVLFRLGILSTVVRATGVLIGTHWGLMGVAWAYVLGGYVFVWYPVWSSAGRIVNLRFSALLRNVAGTVCLCSCDGRGAVAFRSLVVWRLGSTAAAGDPGGAGRVAVRISGQGVSAAGLGGSRGYCAAIRWPSKPVSSLVDPTAGARAGLAASPRHD
jgi:hypothetical protein